MSLVSGISVFTNSFNLNKSLSNFPLAVLVKTKKINLHGCSVNTM